MKRRLLAILLSAIMVMSFGVITMAAEGDTAADTTYTDVSSITITKIYKAVNEGVSPAETFAFTELTCTSVTDAAEGVTTANAPVPTIGSIAYADGDATADGTGKGTKTATIALPEYTSVGVYTYTFSEVVPTTKTAGVTYSEGTFTLVVTVLQQDDKVRVAAVHCEANPKTGTYGESPKTDKFENTYESGTLAVSKTVTGNLGDQSKYFDVTVTFAAASGEAINSTITYTGGKYSEAVAVNNNTATIQLKHGDTVTFANVPEGVTWTVEEADYTTEANGKYDAAQYSASTGTITAGGAATSVITNNKDVQVDTGIALDSIPYILIIALVAIGAVTVFVRRRRAED